MLVSKLLDMVYEYAPIKFEGMDCEVQDFEVEKKFQEAIDASLGSWGFPVEIKLLEKEVFGKVVMFCEERNDIIVCHFYTDGSLLEI